MKKIVLLMFLIILVTFNLLPQLTAGQGRIRGIVLDEETGEPLEGVTLGMYSVRAQAFLKSFPVTGRDGKWKAYSLRGGHWRIEFKKVGYITLRQVFFVDTRAGQKSQFVETKLQKELLPPLKKEIYKKVYKAALLYEENKLQEALQKFLEIKEKYKDSQDIEVVDKYIGNCYAGLKDYPKAIAAYEIALQRFPEEPDLVVSIGNAYTNLGKLEKALEYFNMIPFEKIDNVSTLYNMGVIYYNREKYPEAAKYLKKAVEIDDTFAEAFFQLGLTYVVLEKIDEAVKALEKFMLLAPGSADFQTAKAITDAFSR